MPAEDVQVKAVVTPVSIGGASVVGRRFGHRVVGWLVALPMTSGAVAGASGFRLETAPHDQLAAEVRCMERRA